jgi:putative membrane protein
MDPDISPWRLDLLVIAGLLAASIGYGLLALRLASRGKPLPVRTIASFAAGVLVILAALESPLDALASPTGYPHLLVTHVVQDELLLALAPILVLGSLSPRLLAPVTRWVMKPLLRNPRSRWWVKITTYPAILWALWLALVYG